MVSVLNVVEKGVFGHLLNPVLSFRPREIWPPKAPTARIHRDDSDLLEWKEGLLQWKLCEALRLSIILAWGGSHLLNGMSGVPQDESTPDGVAIHRVIMHMIPLNSIRASIVADVDLLNMVNQCSDLQLFMEEVLLWSSGDLRCMLYLFRMPPE